MPSRLVKVYDRPFPSMDDMIFGDPANPTHWPEEAWAEQMTESEIALFCVNFKDGGPVREEDGRPGPQSDQACRVFNDRAEVERYAQTASEHLLS